MKRLQILLAVMLLGVFAIRSEDAVPKSQQILRFIFVAHDYTTPVPELVERLTDIFEANKADDNGDPLIIYLASGSHPIVVKINVNDETDNPDDFETVLLPELYERSSHDVEPETDVATVLDIFSDLDYADYSNKLLYGSAYFTFFVNKTFWDAGFNESVIVPIYFGLELPDLKGRVNLEIYQPKNNPIHIIDGKPFGEKNVGGINEMINNILYIDN